MRTPDIAVDPLARFEAEHQEMLGELDLLEEVVHALERGESLDQHAMKAQVVLSFLEGAVQRHNQCEEEALFPVLEGRAPTTAFAADHLTLRSLECELERALDPPEDAVAVAETGRQIVDILRDHIDREDNVLFPLARELLGVDGLARVAERIDAEEG